MSDGLCRCPRCGKWIQEDGPCRFCQASGAGAPVPAQPEPGEAAGSPIRGPAAVWVPPPPIWRSPYFLGALSVAALVALAWAFWPLPRYPEEIPLTRWKADPNAEAVGTDPCAGRSRCVVVYLASWCPACRQCAQDTVPQLRQFWKEPDRPGLRVVVGSGEPAKIDEMARLVGDPVYLDATGAFGTRMKVDFFPKFFVVDEANRVMKSGRGAISWMNTEINDRLK